MPHCNRLTALLGALLIVFASPAYGQSVELDMTLEAAVGPTGAYASSKMVHDYIRDTAVSTSSLRETAVELGRVGPESATHYVPQLL
jgi:hypothetical protein